MVPLVGEDRTLALEGRASEEKTDLSRETVVEGYVMEHALHWKKKWNSVGGYLNVDGEQTEDETIAADGADADADAQQYEPPKVSVTLSEYLSADSPKPDPSCDFGWFTPPASASSILSGGDIVLHEQGGCLYRAPSPSYHPTNFLFGRNISVESAAKTLSLSPESEFGFCGSLGGIHNERAEASYLTGGAAWGRGTVSGDSGVSTQYSSPISQFERSLKEQQLVPPPRLSDPKNSSRSNSGSYRGEGSVGGGTGIGGRGRESALVNGSVTSDTTMGVRLLPIACSRSTTTHLNSWHTLYSKASESGDLSSQGKSTLHLKRAGYLISTRHFPEKTPAPASRSGRAGISGSGNWSRGAVGATIHRGSMKLLNGSAPPHSGAGAQQGARDAVHQALRQHQLERHSVCKPKSYSWSITEIRVRQGQRFQPPYAEYLVVVCMGREKLVAGWRRTSEFAKLARVARAANMTKACLAWEALEKARRAHGGDLCSIPLVMRPRRLDAVYLQNKARFLEEFLKQYLFEANNKEALLSFIDSRKPCTMEI